MGFIKIGDSMILSLEEKLTIVSSLTKYVFIDKKETGRWLRDKLELIADNAHGIDLLTSHVVFEYNKFKKGK